MDNSQKVREWWIEDIEANRTVPAEVAKHRYVPVIERSAYDAVVAERDELRETLKLHGDDYVKQVGTWKIIQRLEEERDQAIEERNHAIDFADLFKTQRDQALELLREATEALDRTTHHLENLQVSHPHDCDLDGTLTRIRESGLIEGEK